MMIKKTISFFSKALGCPFAVFGGIVLICVTALAAAFASEIFLGLEPCTLCIYQRWGFVAAGTMAAMGLIYRNKKPLLPLFAGLSGLAFAVNAAIATYHTGVEQKWWVSQVEGCIVSNFGTAPQAILENIMAAPTAPCDKIPWADPILGLSMANYNVALCGFMALAAFMAARAFLRKTV
jgi:disulfide bond formation protein DsbB